MTITGMTIRGMTITGAAPPLHHRLRRRPRGWRRAALLLAVAPALSLAGCRLAGSAVIAPYRSPPVAQVAARVVSGTAGVLALSPDGTVQAVADAGRGVCFSAVRAFRTAPAGPSPCAHVPVGSAALSAAFSADGRWVAVGQDVTAQGHGLVWLVDPRTGAARPVPAAGRAAIASSRPPAAGSAGGSAVPSATRPTAPSTGATRDESAPTYTGLVWGTAGDLLLMSSALEADGPRTRLVDVDPLSLVPRVVAQATGPYEFQSGFLVTGGSTVLLTVYRGDQVPPNLVAIDLASGVRRELAPFGPAGTQLVPLAVSPDGRVAVVGSATLGHSGPPRLLDVASGALTTIPGLAGDFGAAAFAPDGQRIAVASTTADGKTSLSIAAMGAAPLLPARTVGTAEGRLPRGGRLSWSRLDVLSLAGPATPGPASLSGWVLSG